MDDQRRTLTAALVRTPEVEAFLQEGKPSETKAKQPTETRSKITAKERGEDTAPVVSSKQMEPQTESQTEPQADPVVGRISKAKKKPVEKPTPTSLSQPLVAITTRFRPETANALRRVSLERKLAGQSPWTQQEIIEAAVKTWLAQAK